MTDPVDDPANSPDAATVWSRTEIESPCVKICMIHPDARICVGCYRTGDEIAKWSSLTPQERREIIAELPSRGRTLTRRSGGRRGRAGRTSPT